MDYKQKALELHKLKRGKIEVVSKVEIETRDDLSIAYTPGVAEPCLAIHKDEKDSYTYTSRGNLIAVVSDGSAVLGLGNIGPYAAMPVMEGKAVLFKKFANVDAFPICLDTQNVDEIIQTIKHLAPSFGGINLEDINAPKCFEIERRLEEELDIPVFHDDQHGTAIVTTAALMNALKVVQKRMEDITVVVNGTGAAGTAIIKMLHTAGVSNIIACDSTGILSRDRKVNMNEQKLELCGITNNENVSGNLSDALAGADVFIGVSQGNILTSEMVKQMNKDSIIFAMANPTPEIMPDVAKEAGARIIGTGRSDFPNQINNVLAFPGIFRGALDSGARDINSQMKLAAAEAISSLISPEELNEEYIIPSVFDKRVAETVAKHVAEAAIKSGALRK
ncbi:NAD(P)-dependent malic enzyme [Guggenheimella bovis]